MAPAMVHLLENVQSHFVNSDSPVQPPGQQSLDREYGYKIQPGLVNSGSNNSHVEYRTVQPSSTLMPPECVTTISSSELAKKMCKNSTTGRMYYIIQHVYLFRFCLIAQLISSAVLCRSLFCRCCYSCCCCCVRRRQMLTFWQENC